MRDVRGGLPGAPDTGLSSIFLRQTDRVARKIELVILLKPTIIESDRDWEQDLRDRRRRLEALK